MFNQDRTFPKQVDVAGGIVQPLDRLFKTGNFTAVKPKYVEKTVPSWPRQGQKEMVASEPTGYLFLQFAFCVQKSAHGWLFHGNSKRWLQPARPPPTLYPGLGSVQAITENLGEKRSIETRVAALEHLSGRTG